MKIKTEYVVEVGLLVVARDLRSGGPLSPPFSVPAMLAPWLF